MVLLRLDRVDVRLGGRDILRGVSLSLREGESWALLGGNGSGKSTLLRLIRGDEQPTPGTRDRRLYFFPDGPSDSPIGARERIALVSPEQQEAYRRRDWAMTAGSAVATGFGGEVWLPEEPGAPQARAVDEAAARLGIGPLLRRSVLSLSAGEMRRVLLARALVSSPRLLLLDEPCDGLDAPARERLLADVDGIARGGTPVVLATHRPEEIGPAFSRVAVMEEGEIVFQGAPGEAIGHRATSTATPTPTPHPFALSVGPAQRARSRRATPILHVTNAHVRVAGRPVLHGISWTVRRGEHWAITGPNGAGKSTLLRLALGEEQAMPGGAVARLDLGERADVWEVKARVGLVSPELQARFRADVPAEEVVLSGLAGTVGIDFAPGDAERRLAAAAMALAGASHLAGRRIHALSYGEMRRLLFARAVAGEPELLVLDEPLDGLDRGSRDAILALLGRLAAAGATLALATHHREEIPPLVQKELELREGRIAYLGPRR